MRTAFLALVVLAACTGCKSTGPERAEDAVKSIEELAGEFKRLDDAIDTTCGALNAVVENKSGNIKTFWNQFAIAFDAQKDQSGDVMDAARDMKESSDAYLKGWRRQLEKIKDPEIKEKTIDRGKVAEEKFKEAHDNLMDIRKDYVQFETELNDIRIALGNDLNEAGVDTYSDKIAKVTSESAGRVKEHIREIMKGLEAVHETFSPKGEEEEKPAAEGGDPDPLKQD